MATKSETKSNYKVDSKKQIIYANILKLTAKEIEIIKKYQALGFTVQAHEEPKKKVIRLTEDYILEYLGKLENSEKEIQAYKDIKEKIALDENGNIKTYETKKNETKERKVGYNGARTWFSKKYPLDINELLLILTDEQTEKIENLFNDYDKQKEKDLEIAKEKDENATIERMTKDEYTRYYYWTKIFKQEEKKETE